MYDQFYGLQGRPFQLTPDPNYYFESATHRKALSYLGYGLAQGEGFIVITGDIGAGKTTLVGHLMQTVDPTRLTAVKIVSTQVGGDDMLRLAAHSFGLATEGFTKAATLQMIEGFLHNQARAGRRSLLIVDEAQNLAVSAIEELRMLSNFQLGGQSLLQIFLLGQPEFRDLLKSPELEQLRQRVIATHHLEPMLAREVEPYILHRLGIAGWSGNPAFTPAAFSALYAATGGVPRRLNALVSRVLLLGAIEQAYEIDADAVAAVVADMGLDTDLMPAPLEASALDTVEADVAAELEAVVAEAERVEPAPQSLSEPVDVEQEEPAEPESPVLHADAGADELKVEERPWDKPAPFVPRFVDPSFQSEVSTDAEVATEEAVDADVVQASDDFEASDAEDEIAIESQLLEAEAATVEEYLAAAQFEAETDIEPSPAVESIDDVDLAPDMISQEAVEALRRDMQDEIGALRAEIASLRAIQAHAPFAPPASTIDPDALKDCFTLIEERLSTLEFRTEEQDVALRRVLTLLVEWVEREDRMAESDHDAAVARAH